MAGLLDLDGITNALRSHAEKLGNVEKTTGHEPKSAPGKGIRAAFWAQRFGPALGVNSGLAATTALVVMNARFTLNMLYEPQDEIDPMLTEATDLFMAAVIGDLTLGDSTGRIRSVDIRAMAGTPMDCQFGYLPQDGIMFRTAVVTIPVIINDVWTEAS